MRITVDLTPSVQNHAGLGRYAQELTRALLDTRLPDEQLAVFYVDPQRRTPRAPLDTLPATALALDNKPWRMSTLLAHLVHASQDAAVGRPDVFLATDHLLPVLSRAVSVLTLHDLIYKIYPAAHLPLNRWFLSLMMPRFLQAADAIVVVSECTRRDASAIYNIQPHKTHVIYEGIHANFRRPADPQKLEIVRQKYTLPERFFLYVGTIEPRKNLPTLFEAYKQAGLPDIKLVIAGKTGWLYAETLARIKALGLEQDVILTGFVPDDDLPALYSLAVALAFPSRYEGFGLPVLEAMACGTPVLCSNTSSLPEVAGEAALLVAPDDVRGWADAMRQVTNNRALHSDLRERGLRRAARFTWTAAAQQTRELYRDLYAHHS